MAVVNKIIHRFVHPRSDYEENGSLFNQIIPYNVQAYSYELKPNGDPNIPDDYIVRYVLGTGRSTYIEIANGQGRSLEGNHIPELSKEFVLNSSTQLIDIVTKLIESQVIVSSYITSDAEGTPFATKAALDEAEVWYDNGQSVLPKKNDYVIVTADETHPTGTGDPQTARYVCTGINSDKPVWEYQYVINTGNFTPEQQAAIDSGITAEKVALYDSYAEALDDLTAHLTDYNNPHKVTAEQVGLGNVDNTSDLDKPVSTATQEALDSINEDLTTHAENEDIHVTAKEKVAWTNKQDALKMGNHIKIANDTISVLDDLSTYDNTISQFVNKSTDELENYYTKDELDGVYRYLGEVETKGDLPNGNEYAPDTYTELTYLLADQLEYIDTQYHPNQRTKIVLKFSINGAGNNYLYGTDLVTEDNKVAFGINYGTTTAKAFFGEEEIPFEIDDKVHTLIQRKSAVYLDGVQIDTYPDIEDFTTESTLWLFRAQTPDTHPENISIYKVEIYENDELIKHYIPVKRNEDNALGLYEVLSGEFKQNEYNIEEFDFIPGQVAGYGNHIGDVYKVVDENTLYMWNGTSWVLFIAGGGIGGVTDVKLYNIATGEYETVVNNTIALLAPEASDVAYSNSQYPAMQTLQDAVDELLYNPSVKVDDTTIVKDENNTITTVGVKTKSDTIMYDWIGTEAEWEAGRANHTIPDGWICWITDDEEEPAGIANLAQVASTGLLEDLNDVPYLPVDKLVKDYMLIWNHLTQSFAWVEVGEQPQGEYDPLTYTLTIQDADWENETLITDYIIPIPSGDEEYDPITETLTVSDAEWDDETLTTSSIIV